MKPIRLNLLLRGETGSSLLVTLVMITVMTILIGAVMAFYMAQYRFFRRDVHRLQARYAAEAGVYVAIDSLQQNPFWQATNKVLALPENQESQVTVEAFGGYLLIRSEADYRRSRSTVRALVGEVPPADFHNAVMLWDTESSLHVAGHTRITGSIVVGERGVRESTFNSRRFTGRIDGTIYKVPGLRPAYFDGFFLQNAIDNADQLLQDGATATVPEEAPLATRLPSENHVHYAAGSLRLTPSDSLLLAKPITIIAQGNLTLEGPLRFQPGTLFLAGKSLTVAPGVRGREGLFYGRDHIEVAADVQCSGQFFSRKVIHVAQDAYLDYPSVLYVSGEHAEMGGEIRIADGAIVNGTVVHPPITPAPTRSRGRIVVEPAALVRGAIFNAHETEFHGTLYGSLLSNQYYFYESPSSYVNWIKDATVDVDERPVKYVLPLRFSLRPKLAILNWEVYTEEPAATI